MLVIHDATLAVTAGELRLEASLAGRPHLVVYNKVDLLVEGEEPAELGGGAAIRTSALTGEGLAALREAILARLGAAGSLAESGALNNFRQQEAVSSTLVALCGGGGGERIGAAARVDFDGPASGAAGTGLADGGDDAG